MGTKARHRQKASSFNPARCLRPPTINATTPRNSNSGNMSPLPSTLWPKKSHRHQRPEFTVEPTSPRVRCMGQIRRCKAPSGPATCSTHSSSAPSSASPQFNLLKTKRRAAASGSVDTSSSSSISTSSVSSSASPVSVIPGDFSLLMIKRFLSTRVSFEEMDPPRPVERTEGKPEGSVSLWKRRCGGGGGLQLKLQAMEPHQRLRDGTQQSKESHFCN